MKITRPIWLTYDLGVGGDYKSLYAWLDDHGAVDCGNNLAFFKYTYSADDKSDKSFADKLLKDIKEHVDLVAGNRIYVVRPYMDGDKIGTKGTFIFGKRMASPWEGYGSRDDTQADE